MCALVWKKALKIELHVLNPRCNAGFEIRSIPYSVGELRVEFR